MCKALDKIPCSCPDLDGESASERDNNLSSFLLQARCNVAQGFLQLRVTL